MPEPKHEKFALRVTARQKAVIEHAAGLQQTTMTSFIIDKAYEAAAEVILEQRHVILNEGQWQTFNNALNAPAKDLPQLRQLITQVDIWEG
jgi:uncharacterized protein (DUF1778 family)